MYRTLHLSLPLIGLLVPLVLALALPGRAAVERSPDDRAGTCPWCLNDPERLAALGAMNHGPFPIGKTESGALAELLPGNPWRFIETKHLRIASNLRDESLNAKQRKKLEPVFERLRGLIPDFPKKVKKLDPWLRLHLAALRSEDFYTRFQELLGVTDADFPVPRDFNGPFMGDGLYLGEKEKFELLYHSRRATHMIFTKETMGVTVTDALRWHLSPPHKMLASIPAEDADLVSQEWLWPHTAHLLSHLYLCAYKHFSFDPPIWLDEGLAHVMEREIEPLSTTIDGDEGTGPHRGGHEDWRGRDRRIVKRNKQPSLAEMMHINSFSDMSKEQHVVAWSMVRFLVNEKPAEFARFVGGIKGQLDEQGYPTGNDLLGLQRRLLKEIFGWTPAAFDEAWKSWVLAEQ